MIAVARILMPRAHVRLSAGRGEMSDELQALCFMAGANSIFYGESCSPPEIPTRRTTCGSVRASQDSRRALDGTAPGAAAIASDGLDRLTPPKSQELAAAPRSSRDGFGRTGSVSRPFVRPRRAKPVCVISSHGPALISRPTTIWGSRPRSASPKSSLRLLAAGAPVGAGGSRLLRGNAPEHEELEAAAAAFFHAERALFFGGGYLANFAVLTTLPQRAIWFFWTSCVHASAREGARAGRAPTVPCSPTTMSDAVETRDCRLARGGWRGPDLDRGREPLQHGRRFRAAGRSRRTGRAVRCIPGHR